MIAKRPRALREQRLTTRGQGKGTPHTLGGRRSETRSIGARVEIPVFELIDAAATFSHVSRSRIVEDGATTHAREIITRHTELLAKHKRRMREERRARRAS